MLDDFFTRALIAGVGLAVTAGPLGCFIVWRRLAYFGDTMAHAALLGVALAFLFEINLMLGVFCAGLGVALALVFLEKRGLVASDAILGILSHSTLALGLVLVGLMSWLRIDLLAFLFGDILSVDQMDLIIIYCGGGLVLGGLWLIWRPLLVSTVSSELAEAEGLNPVRARLIMMILLALVIAIAMKIVGVLLITALLIIPAATARRFAVSPETMAFFAGVVGVLAVVAGLFGSLQFDTPSGPSIVVAALLLFLLSMGLRRSGSGHRSHPQRHS